MLLISLSLFSLTILTWSIFGRIPVRISGKGVLIKPNSLTVVQSETNGQIAELSVNVGDCIDEQSLLARIDPVSQEIEMKAVKTQLDQMLIQDEAQDVLAQQRLRQLQADIERVTHLAQTGAMSTDELNRRRRELSQLRYAMESENSRREQQIKEQQNRILSRQEEIERTSLIRAPIAGALSIGASIKGKWFSPVPRCSPCNGTGQMRSLKARLFSRQRREASGARTTGSRQSNDHETTTPWRHRR